MVGSIEYIGGKSGGEIPIQPEARAYFARMTAPPSQPFRKAVNEAIFDWKRRVGWSSIRSLYLFCADTQQAALLNVIEGLPDASVTGTPTFVTLKGFSGLSASNVVNLGGLNLATFFPNDQFFSCLAAIIDATVTGTNAIRSDAGVAASTVGHFTTGTNGLRHAGALTPIVHASMAGSVLVGGGYGGVRAISGGGISTGSGGLSGRSANYRTNAVAPHPITRLSAYALVDGGLTDPTYMAFAATLSRLMGDLGAVS